MILPYTNPDEVSSLTGQTVEKVHCDMATAIIMDWVGFDYSQLQAFTDKPYSGDGKEWLDLGFYPISAITNVKIDGSLLDADKYKTPAQHGAADGYLYNATQWEIGVGNITVTFEYGYAEVPELVKHICSQIAALMKKETQVQNIRSESIGEYSVSYITDEADKTETETLLRPLPRRSSISAVGQQPDNTTLRDQLYARERSEGLNM